MARIESAEEAIARAREALSKGGWAWTWIETARRQNGDWVITLSTVTGARRFYVRIDGESGAVVEIKGTEAQG